MQPTSDTSLQRPDLGAAVWETMQNAPEQGYIGLQVMPLFGVTKNSAEYPVIPKKSLFNLLDATRASHGGYNRFDDEFESGYYVTSEKGLEHRIDRRYAAIYSSLFAYELTISRILMNNILRAQEKRIADKIMNASNFTAHNATVAWDTPATADPLKDINAGRESLRASGITPNKLIINYTNYMQLIATKKVQDAVYQIFPDAAKTGNIGIKHLEAYLDIPILLAGALYNTAKRGQDASLSDLWGTRYAMLCRVASGDITEPCIGRTFIWNESGNGAAETIVEQYYKEEIRSDILRVRHDVSESFLLSRDENGTAKSEISKACGYLIDTTAAS